jgi:predicted ATPase
MRLLAFRIRNFRSVVDTGWQNFSNDGITVLVGQNESGKTSILEALAKCLDPEEAVTPHDIRLSADPPEVHLRANFNAQDFAAALAEFSADVKDYLIKHYAKKNNEVELQCYWELDEGKYTIRAQLGDEEVQTALRERLRASLLSDQSVAAEVLGTATTGQSTATAELKPPEVEDVAWSLYRHTPHVTLFQAQSGFLPNLVDILPNGDLGGDSAKAASNYLLVAGIDLPKLVGSDLRTRGGTLKRANEFISRDFAKFWSQTIGDSTQLQLESEFQTYGAEFGEKAGKSYLAFWISDGLNKLHPSQRSLGVQWFISFYLQLKATEKKERNRLFLLDEPGANLHAKAQRDVLRLINNLQSDIQIVYSTHNPDLIEYEKLFRILVVQRRGDRDDSPSEVIDAHRIGSASRDSLTPILNAMGADLSHQQVVKKSRNIILEEISAFYYLSAFWQLTQCKEIAHFIAATGVDNVEQLANMFLGWGLGFIVAIDDDSHGRSVFNKIKRDMFGDDLSESARHLLKFPNCPGIEDVFSEHDFKSFVLKDPQLNYATKNSEYVKKNSISKAILAYRFQLAVSRKEISMDDLDLQTRDKIIEIVGELVQRLTS